MESRKKKKGATGSELRKKKKKRFLDGRVGTTGKGEWEEGQCKRTLAV